MTHHYKGFLFGHYDSRGGATFIVGDDEFAARLAYIEVCGQTVESELEDAKNWKDDAHAAPFWAELWAAREDRNKVVRMLTDEDFIAKARIESYRPLEEGEDLEYDTDGPNDTDDESKWEYGLWANWGVWNDGVGQDTPAPEVIEFLLVEPTTQPPREGFRRSEFGEDACGIIFVTPKEQEK